MAAKAAALVLARCQAGQTLQQAAAEWNLGPSAGPLALGPNSSPSPNPNPNPNPSPRPSPNQAAAEFAEGLPWWESPTTT